jgi:hypothetical protein
MTLDTKVEPGSKDDEYSLYSLNLVLDSLDSDIVSQMEVIEIIFEPGDYNDFLLDNCILQ